MAQDVSALNNTLASARINQQNPALHQLLKGIIDFLSGLEGLNLRIDALDARINQLRVINLIQVETTAVATSFELDQYVDAMTLFKDITGDAAANPITLVGTVDGVFSPQINTNFGWFGVFLGDDGLYHQWA